MGESIRQIWVKHYNEANDAPSDMCFIISSAKSALTRNSAGFAAAVGLLLGSVLVYLSPPVLVQEKSFGGCIAFAHFWFAIPSYLLHETGI